MKYLDDRKILYLLDDYTQNALQNGVLSINMDILMSLMKQLNFSKEALSVLVHYVSNEYTKYSGLPAIEELNIDEINLRRQGYTYNCIDDVTKMINLITDRKKELYIYYSKVTQDKVLELVKI